MPGIVGVFVPDCLEKKAKDRRVLEIEKAINIITPVKERNKIYIKFKKGFIGIKKGFKGWGWDVYDKEGITVVLLGEIYFKGYGNNSIAQNNKAEVIWRLFKKYKTKFLTFIDGIFNIVIASEIENKYYIFSDRYNRIPVYYLKDKAENLYFSTEIKSIMYIKKWKEFNPDALVQLFTYEGIIGNTTLYKDIYLLSPGMYIVYKEGNIRRKNYYEVQINDKDYPVRDAADKFYFLFKESMKRCLQGKVGIFLSGGYDTRLISLMAKRMKETPLLFTFGISQSEDVKIAKEVAKRLNLEWFYLGMNPCFLKEWGEKGVYITEGMFNIIRMHGIDKLQTVSQKVEYVLNGFGGDYLLRFAGWLPDRRSVSETALAKFLLPFANITLPIQWIDSFFSKDFLKSLKAHPLYYLFTFAKHCGIRTREEIRLYYFIKERMQKLTALGIYLDSPFVFTRTPYASKDLVDFVLGLPPKYRRAENLRRNVLKKYFKKYLDIPIASTGISPRYHLFYQICARWHKKKTMVNYTDYANWFRVELREMIEDYITTKRLKETGIFNLKYIKKLWKEHLTGKNYTSIIGMLVTFSIWLEHMEKIAR